MLKTKNPVHDELDFLYLFKFANATSCHHIIDRYTMADNSPAFSVVSFVTRSDNDTTLLTPD